jgi:hypothetical protein
VDKNIETLATALHVRVDDLLLAEPGLAPWVPEGSMVPTVSDAELLAMAVMSALPGFRSERRRVDRGLRSGPVPELPPVSVEAGQPPPGRTANLT